MGYYHLLGIVYYKFLYNSSIISLSKPSRILSYSLLLILGGSLLLMYLQTVFLDSVTLLMISLIGLPRPCNTFTCCHLYMLITTFSPPCLTAGRRSLLAVTYRNRGGSVGG